VRFVGHILPINESAQYRFDFFLLLRFLNSAQNRRDFPHVGGSVSESSVCQRAIRGRDPPTCGKSRLIYRAEFKKAEEKKKVKAV